MRRSGRRAHHGVSKLASGAFRAVLVAPPDIYQEIGEFDTSEAAARAVDRATITHFGTGKVPAGRLNFPTDMSGTLEVDSNNGNCDVCEMGGELLCCDFCSLTFHLRCLEPPLDKPPTGDWKCPVCSLEGGGQLGCCPRCKSHEVRSVEALRLHFEGKCKKAAKLDYMSAGPLGSPRLLSTNASSSPPTGSSHRPTRPARTGRRGRRLPTLDDGDGSASATVGSKRPRGSNLDENHQTDLIRALEESTAAANCLIACAHASQPSRGLLCCLAAMQVSSLRAAASADDRFAKLLESTQAGGASRSPGFVLTHSNASAALSDCIAALTPASALASAAYVRINDTAGSSSSATASGDKTLIAHPSGRLPSSILLPIRQVCRRFASINLGSRRHQRQLLLQLSLKERRARGQRLYRGVAINDSSNGVQPIAGGNFGTAQPRAFSASVRIDGHTHTLGSYACPEEAARVHDVVLAMGGQTTGQNWSDDAKVLRAIGDHAWETGRCSTAIEAAAACSQASDLLYQDLLSDVVQVDRHQAPTDAASRSSLLHTSGVSQWPAVHGLPPSAMNSVQCLICNDDPNVTACESCGCRVCFGTHDAWSTVTCSLCNGVYHRGCMATGAPKANKDGWVCPALACQGAASKQIHQTARSSTKRRAASEAVQSLDLFDMQMDEIAAQGQRAGIALSHPAQDSMVRAVALAIGTPVEASSSTVLDPLPIDAQLLHACVSRYGAGFQLAGGHRVSELLAGIASVHRSVHKSAALDSIAAASAKAEDKVYSQSHRIRSAALQQTQAVAQSTAPGPSADAQAEQEKNPAASVQKLLSKRRRTSAAAVGGEPTTGAPIAASHEIVSAVQVHSSQAAIRSQLRRRSELDTRDTATAPDRASAAGSTVDLAMLSVAQPEVRTARTVRENGSLLLRACQHPVRISQSLSWGTTGTGLDAGGAPALVRPRLLGSVAAGLRPGGSTRKPSASPASVLELRRGSVLALCRDGQSWKALQSTLRPARSTKDLAPKARGGSSSGYQGLRSELQAAASRFGAGTAVMSGKRPEQVAGRSNARGRRERHIPSDAATRLLASVQANSVSSDAARAADALDAAARTSAALSREARSRRDRSLQHDTTFLQQPLENHDEFGGGAGARGWVGVQHTHGAHSSARLPVSGPHGLDILAAVRAGAASQQWLAGAHGLGSQSGLRSISMDAAFGMEANHMVVASSEWQLPVSGGARLHSGPCQPGMHS